MTFKDFSGTRISRLRALPVGAIAGCIFLLTEAVSRGDVITIPVEADSVVDSLVPFPYQGTNANLWTNYDPTFGPSISRSYLRFSLEGVSEVDRILSARLNLNLNLVLNGGNVELYPAEPMGEPITRW